jgi:hypothetical protein
LSWTGWPSRPGSSSSSARKRSFCGSCHHLQILDLVSVEGPAYLLDDLAARLADDEARRVVLDTARALERVPELLGIGAHLLATGRK